MSRTRSSPHQRYPVKVDPPQIPLRRAVLQQEGFFVGVQLGIDGHDPSLDVDDRLDHGAEPMLGHTFQLREANPVPDDLHHVSPRKGQPELMVVIAMTVFLHRWRPDRSRSGGRAALWTTTGSSIFSPR